MKRLAIITTHPIQYHAPLFRLLAERNHIQTRVFYTWGSAVLENKYDPGFGKAIAWDIPLLEGYDHVFEKNRSRDPGSHHFKGIDNPELINDIKEWKADAVLVYGWSFKSHLQVMRYFHKKIPVFFRGDSTLLDQQQGIKKMLRKIFLSWVYRHADKAFYVGSNNKAYFEAHGLRNDQLVFAPHAIDNARFAADSASKELAARQWRSELGISEKDIVFLFAGKLETKKEPLLLAKAFSQLSILHTKLIFVGNGKLEEVLKSRYGANPRIFFIPFQNQQQMPVVYRLGDVFVLPSIGPGETWGLSINEAMACGRAILASNACGAAIDLIKDGQNGYIFSSGNRNQLVEKMKLMAAGKAGLLPMGQASAAMIQNWNMEHVADVLETTLNEIKS